MQKKFTDKTRTLEQIPVGWILIAASVLFYIAYWCFLWRSGAAERFSLLGAVAGVAGLTCNVLCAKRNIWNYLFGLINVTLYAYIAYLNRIYGDVALNLIYYLPMQFIGFFSWRKKRAVEEDLVVSRRMSTRNRLIMLVLSAALVIGAGYVLKAVNDPQPFKDSATTVLSIIAMVLMVMAYMEQWYLWIFVNALAVIMWIILYVKGGEASAEMIIMWTFFLINSIYGFIVWKHAADRSRKV